jgi:hypothetical protein
MAAWRKQLSVVCRSALVAALLPTLACGRGQEANQRAETTGSTVAATGSAQRASRARSAAAMMRATRDTTKTLWARVVVTDVGDTIVRSYGVGFVTDEDGQLHRARFTLIGYLEAVDGQGNAQRAMQQRVVRVPPWSSLPPVRNPDSLILPGTTVEFGRVPGKQLRLRMTTRSDRYGTAVCTVNPDQPGPVLDCEER